MIHRHLKVIWNHFRTKFVIQRGKRVRLADCLARRTIRECVTQLQWDEVSSQMLWRHGYINGTKQWYTYSNKFPKSVGYKRKIVGNKMVPWIGGLQVIRNAFQTIKECLDQNKVGSVLAFIHSSAAFSHSDHPFIPHLTEIVPKNKIDNEFGTFSRNFDRGCKVHTLPETAR